METPARWRRRLDGDVAYMEMSLIWRQDARYIVTSIIWRRRLYGYVNYMEMSLIWRRRLYRGFDYMETPARYAEQNLRTLHWGVAGTANIIGNSVRRDN